MSYGQISQDHLALGMVALLIPVGILGWFNFQSAKAGYTDMANQVRECQMLAKEIVELRNERSVASRSTQESPLSNEPILSLLKEADIADNKLGRIERLTPKAIPETEYVRDDAVISLTGLTLEELIRVIVAADNSSQEMTPTSLILGWPGQSTDSLRQPETWSVDVILTHLVYDATSQKR